MMVEMLDPGDKDLILDPACGTGGFLIAAMNHVVTSIKDEVRASGRSRRLQDDSIRDRKRFFLENNLVGMDFNPNLVRATKMNMVMNNDGSGGLYQANSLDSPSRWTDDLRARKLMGSVDLILTNPPFGSKIPIDDPAILDQFDLGHHWDYDEDADVWVKSTRTTSRPPEILFIERCVQLLKPETGRAALVLPDGILGSPGLGFVRQWILAHTTILASVDLHPDTFQPGTSVQTSVLVLQRKSDGRSATRSRLARSRTTRSSWPSAIASATTSAATRSTYRTTRASRSCARLRTLSPPRPTVATTSSGTSPRNASSTTTQRSRRSSGHGCARSDAGGRAGGV